MSPEPRRKHSRRAIGEPWRAALDIVEAECGLAYGSWPTDAKRREPLEARWTALLLLDAERAGRTPLPDLRADARLSRRVEPLAVPMPVRRKGDPVRVSTPALGATDPVKRRRRRLAAAASAVEE
jgi:hypothetical protein